MIEGIALPRECRLAVHKVGIWPFRKRVYVLEKYFLRADFGGGYNVWEPVIVPKPTPLEDRPIYGGDSDV